MGDIGVDAITVLLSSSSGYGMVKVRERVERIRSGFVACVGAWLFSQNRSGQDEVSGGCMFELLAEGAYLPEFAVARSEWVFVRWHGLGDRYEPALLERDPLINHLGGGAMLRRLVGLRHGGH
jgi:hypothetical protein